MADFARLLISKILAEKDLQRSVTAGIRADWFEDEEHQRAYSWMCQYYAKFGACPTIRVFHQEFPTYRVLQVEEPYDYYIEHFQLQRQRSILVDTIIDSNASLKLGDISAAQHQLSQGLIRLGTEVTTLVDENAIGEGKVSERIKRYKARRRDRGRLVGIATGFPSLDLASGGWQPEQFIVFGGQPKQKKSFLLLKSAMAAQDWGRKVLFLSFEMSKEEQLVRYDAMAAGLNARHLLQGDVTDDEFLRLRKGLAQRRHLAPFIVSADTSASTTVSGLAGKIEQHQPDIVFIDGLYLMDNDIGADPQSPQAFTSISRGLKRLAQRTKVPIVGNTQALPSKVGKGGVITLGSLGYTSAWAMDADIILGVESVDGAPLVKVRVVGGRNVAPMEITLVCDFDRSEFEEVDVEDDEAEQTAG